VEIVHIQAKRVSGRQARQGLSKVEVEHTKKNPKSTTSCDIFNSRMVDTVNVSTRQTRVNDSTSQFNIRSMFNLSPVSTFSTVCPFSGQHLQGGCGLHSQPPLAETSTSPSTTSSQGCCRGTSCGRARRDGIRVQGLFFFFPFAPGDTNPSPLSPFSPPHRDAPLLLCAR
jgi:hypothetical protein